jgi:hypothetical protein
VLLGVAGAATVSMARVAPAKQVLPLMVPYLAWMSFAGALNYNLLANNPNVGQLPAARARGWGCSGRSCPTLLHRGPPRMHELHRLKLACECWPAAAGAGRRQGGAGREAGGGQEGRVRRGSSERAAVAS